jgi:hypothetical protein
MLLGAIVAHVLRIVRFIVSLHVLLFLGAAVDVIADIRARAVPHELLALHIVLLSGTFHNIRFNIYMF